MSGPTHTPGPWRAHREGNGVSDLRGADGTPIIDVDCLEFGTEVSPDVWFEATPEDLALMAAAPDLLEALVMVRDADDDCRRDGLPTIPYAARKKIDAAIQKARGEQP